MQKRNEAKQNKTKHTFEWVKRFVCFRIHYDLQCLMFFIHSFTISTIATKHTSGKKYDRYGDLSGHIIWKTLISFSRAEKICTSCHKTWGASWRIWWKIQPPKTFLEAADSSGERDPTYFSILVAPDTPCRRRPSGNSSTRDSIIRIVFPTNTRPWRTSLLLAASKMPLE